MRRSAEACLPERRPPALPHQLVPVLLRDCGRHEACVGARVRTRTRAALRRLVRVRAAVCGRRAKYVCLVLFLRRGSRY